MALRFKSLNWFKDQLEHLEGIYRPSTSQNLCMTWNGLGLHMISPEHLTRYGWFTGLTLSNLQIDPGPWSEYATLIKRGAHRFDLERQEKSLLMSFFLFFSRLNGLYYKKLQPPFSAHHMRSRVVVVKEDGDLDYAFFYDLPSPEMRFLMPATDMEDANGQPVLLAYESYKKIIETMSIERT